MNIRQQPWYQDKKTQQAELYNNKEKLLQHDKNEEKFGSSLFLKYRNFLFLSMQMYGIVKLSGLFRTQAYMLIKVFN